MEENKQTWFDAINLRERRKELEQQLSDINDSVTSLKAYQVENDEMRSERLRILLKDQGEIERELGKLDNAEEIYQYNLEQRAIQIAEEDKEAKKFLDAVQIAITQLDKDVELLQESHAQVQGIQSSVENMIRTTDKKENLLSSEAIARLSNSLRGLQVNTEKSFGNSPLGIWDILDQIDELQSDIAAKLQDYIAQKIELKLRKEEYIEQYEGPSPE